MTITLNGTTGITTPSIVADTDTLYVDATNDKVGIGTSSPSQKLTVSATSNDVMSVISTSDTNADLYLKATGTTLGNVRLRANANDMVFITGLAEQARITSAGALQFNSGYGSVGTAYGCRAWVNFSGSGASIRGSGNVSSITRNGNCDYTVNFTTAMPDTNYATVATANSATGQAGCVSMAFGGLGGTVGSLYSTTQVEMFVQNTNGTRSTDVTMVNVAVFR